MKITCTHCQAGYDVDLPEIKPEGVEFKCVKCEQKFLVTPQNTDQPKEKVATATSALSGRVSESDVDEEKEPHTENQSSSEEIQQPPPEDNLDNLLDDFLKEDLDPKSEENIITEQGAKAEPEASSEGADDLDGLLDDLMADDIAETADTKITETDTNAATTSEAADDLDGLLDDLMADDIAETDTNAATTSEGADDLDGLLDDLMADDIAETADTKITETETEDDLDDLLNDLDDDDEKEDETVAETADTETTETDTEDDLDDILNDLDDDDEKEDDAGTKDEDALDDDELEDDAETKDEDALDDDELGDDAETKSSPKKKIGPFTIPTTKTGKMIAVGCVAALLLTSGGLYFGWKTLAPEELVEMGKLDTEIPEELTPKPEEGTDITEPKVDEVPLEEPQNVKKDPAKEENRPTGVLGAKEDKDSDLAKELGSSETLKALGIEGDFGPAIDPAELQVTLSTIMPVAFNATDIKVLSFKLIIETFDKPSAQVIKEALPIYQKTTLITVENFLKNKFFNDIFYVKEKLQRRLQKKFDRIMESTGRIKKVKFEEFVVK